MVNEIDVTVRGFVGHNPTLNQREGRQPYLRLNVASTPRVRDRDGEWGDGRTQWFAVKFFGSFAANAAGSVRKGDAVLVRGRLEHEEYLSRDGEQRWSAVIIADAFGPDLRYAEASVRRVTRSSAADESAESADGEPENAGAGDAHEQDGAEADGFSGGVDVSGLVELPDDETPVDPADDGDRPENGYLVEKIGA
ncbi:single-stranded DNA-binding protein [Ruania halotolerans]|uniref:single-stranded DNA-binding protein n=1 Tax=Ruania halotolerans TaxID=2897773 RepID=UPI001E2C15D4|nr:single-stranded DNA-binding protein [Ruania halotolerans]UFU05320.1 single-stranded DNA-binding protein [Ruania halotolerans]